MKYLVTGSEGSLMQAVIPKLLAKGEQVKGVDMRPHDPSAGDYEFMQGDLTNFDFCLEATKDVDIVIQSAARIYGIGGFNKYCADILGDNLTLHSNVLKACVQNGVRHAVYISSSMVYETCVQSLDHPLTEELMVDCPVPRTDYGLSKYVGERITEAFYKQYRLSYTIWRPFNIITPFEAANKESIGISHVFADFISNIVDKQLSPLPIIGDGSQIRCFTWIDDVAEAIAQFSADARTKNEAFNLGNPEPTSMKELACMIAEVAAELGYMEKKELTFETVKEYKDDVRVRVPDVSKAERVLGWQATVKTRESIKRCLQTWKGDK